MTEFTLENTADAEFFHAGTSGGKGHIAHFVDSEDRFICTHSDGWTARRVRGSRLPSSLMFELSRAIGERKEDWAGENGVITLPQPTPTQWIPFDKDRMSEAIEYRYGHAQWWITDVKHYEVKDGLNASYIFKDKLCLGDASDIEMLVPVVVKYPCVCRHEADVNDQVCARQCDGWTPLTTAELAEIGLKQIS